MRVGGVLLLIFIPLHILHFTTGTIQPAGSFSDTDVFANVVSSFQIWWVTLAYVVVMVALGLHLYHGAWSSVRSLGLSQPSRDPLHRTVALAVAAIVWAGFTAIPIAVYAGIIG
jgi:succinate dehydrogenase / fumarate reductase cytochrome b subunit